MTLTRLRIGAAFLAAALVGYGSTLPLWTMTMKAPQYPKGLRLDAYGTQMAGDVSELNILNHYIGMPPLEAPALETAIFPYGIATLVGLALLSPLHRWLRWAAIAAAVATPLVILADLQFRLYEFGHSLNPKAPIRLKPFTPLVLGETEMGNFVSTGMVSFGFWCLIVAALLLWTPGFLSRRLERPRRTSVPSRAAAAAMAIAVSVLYGAAPNAAPTSLQARLDAAAPGSTVVVPAGVYRGAIAVRGPLTVVGEPGAIVDGEGAGSVVTIAGRGVHFRGFTVQNSGRNVTEEAAGIKVTGNDHRIEHNRVHDVYFGIHVGDGAGVLVANNEITPGATYGARPGHGVSAWHLRESEIVRNRIAAARDGIYLSFTDGVLVADNSITNCRYGLHSMYSQRASFVRNDATANLLGAALMNSERLMFRDNRIRHHRQGAAAYGVLLKDIGDLIAEGNQILSNRVGIYAEAVPANPSNEAVFVGNVIAGNEVGLALQSTAALTFTDNRIADNLTDVRALGRQLSAGMRWSRQGRGNAWGQYRGFDANDDGIGDIPYRLEDAMDALVRRNDSIQAFLYTPAHLAIEAAARLFPLYRQAPILVDNFPLMSFGGGR
jgi:nitrous oxidase accessory protein